MAKSKLTTAQHRNIAFDAFESRDYLTAAKHYSLAVHKYPSTIGALSKDDIKMLTQKRDISRKLYKSSKKGF